MIATLDRQVCGYPQFNSIITPDIGDKNVTRNPRRLTSKNIQIQKTVMSKSITALLTLIAACSISTVQAQVNAADSVTNVPLK